MIVLSHRGYWLKKNEKNTSIAFERSFSLGFGVEIDVRDWKGKLVISHNPPLNECMSFQQFLDIYTSFEARPKIAINIKADGLHDLLEKQLQQYEINNYFLFDMSVPDAILYLNKGMNIYTRQSEYEENPSFFDMSNGVWLDEFHRHWITNQSIINHLNAKKKICIVSPELHGRTYKSEWEHYKELELRIGKNKMMICTDYPEKAEDFFNA
ncbi:hypothetical protein NX722_05945 [Endozoicomonas gorgoniicola]|uniref:Phosphodiesterase n=1 Tax=Endozoicomonas gorgoniicola TaxID=1234144 RepID=A0ABT3MS49_9GAMM|nr:hypothetical protein [Endozoicomonas gorgoniicola]MCW7552196.1 hypothetical protein [Endozoicomonas gorgoniicola]